MRYVGTFRVFQVTQPLRNSPHLHLFATRYFTRREEARGEKKVKIKLSVTFQLIVLARELVLPNVEAAGDKILILHCETVAHSLELSRKFKVRLRFL